MNQIAIDFKSIATVVRTELATSVLNKHEVTTDMERVIEQVVIPVNMRIMEQVRKEAFSVLPHSHMYYFHPRDLETNRKWQRL